MKSNYRENIKTAFCDETMDMPTLQWLVSKIAAMPENSSIVILAETEKHAKEYAWHNINLQPSRRKESALMIEYPGGRFLMFRNYKQLERICGLKIFAAIVVHNKNTDVEQIKHDLAPFMIELSHASEN